MVMRDGFFTVVLQSSDRKSWTSVRLGRPEAAFESSLGARQQRNADRALHLIEIFLRKILLLAAR